MLKHLSIFTALIVLGTGSANAQQREAVLQKVEVPNAGFNLVLAMPKPGTPSLYLRDQPDPNAVGYLGFHGPSLFFPRGAR